MSETSKEKRPKSGKTAARLLLASPPNATLSERVESLEEQVDKLVLLLAMSRSISAEKELDKLMELIVRHTTEIMNCERSSLFLLDQEKSELYSLVAEGLVTREIRFSLSSGIAGYAVREGVVVNIPDAYQDSRFNPAIDKATGYRTRSVLCLPMKDRRGQMLGVIQCLNKRNPEGPEGPVAVFDKKDELFLDAVGSQAAAFLENTSLYRQMDKLFESFVDAMSHSIDDRDPCTSGHSRRVTHCALNLARAVHDSQIPPFDQVEYTRERLRQLRYAGLLHDVGKIGVRENVLAKQYKLPPVHIEALRQRIAAAREKFRADCLAACLKDKLEPQAALSARYAPLAESLNGALKIIEAANLPVPLSDANFQELQRLAGEGLLTADEFHNLSVRQGNLTAEEWADMRSHVTKSYRMLTEIPWPAELRDLPEIAFTHHERYDGSGYPRNLKEQQILLDGQVLAVADVYDALVASDRPYKKAVPHDKAKAILEQEAAAGHLLPPLVKLFFDAKCYELK